MNIGSVTPAASNLDTYAAANGTGRDGNARASTSGSTQNDGLDGELASNPLANAAGITSSQYDSMFAAARSKSPYVTQAVFDKFILPEVAQVRPQGLDDAITGAVNGYVFVRERFDANPDKSNIPGDFEIGVEAVKSGIANSSSLDGAALNAGGFAAAAKSAATAWRYDGLY